MEKNTFISKMTDLQLIGKARNMENILSLNEEIEVLLKKKSFICECNPCTCAEHTKDIYFKELKHILEGFNLEYLGFNLLRSSSFNQLIPKNI